MVKPAGFLGADPEVTPQIRRAPPPVRAAFTNCQAYSDAGGVPLCTRRLV